MIMANAIQEKSHLGASAGSAVLWLVLSMQLQVTKAVWAPAEDKKGTFKAGAVERSPVRQFV
jgi:hypothetical protein